MERRDSVDSRDEVESEDGLKVVGQWSWGGGNAVAAEGKGGFWTSCLADFFIGTARAVLCSDETFFIKECCTNA